MENQPVDMLLICMLTCREKDVDMPERYARTRPDAFSRKNVSTLKNACDTPERGSQCAAQVTLLLAASDREAGAWQERENLRCLREKGFGTDSQRVHFR